MPKIVTSKLSTCIRSEFSGYLFKLLGISVIYSFSLLSRIPWRGFTGVCLVLFFYHVLTKDNLIVFNSGVLEIKLL